MALDESLQFATYASCAREAIRVFSALANALCLRINRPLMASILYPPETVRASVGLLLIRVIGGCMLALHGWPKIKNAFHWMGAEAPIPGILQACAALAEFGGGIALALGFLTPVAALAVIITMAVALAMVHVPAGHPIVANAPGPSQEPALFYLSLGFLLLFTGPGAASIDRLIFGARSRF
jgi:putative oxidoreductase